MDGIPVTSHYRPYPLLFLLALGGPISSLLRFFNFQLAEVKPKNVSTARYIPLEKHHPSMTHTSLPHNGTFCRLLASTCLSIMSRRKNGLGDRVRGLCPVRVFALMELKFGRPEESARKSIGELYGKADGVCKDLEVCQ